MQWVSEHPVVATFIALGVLLLVVAIVKSKGRIIGDVLEGVCDAID